VSPAEAQGMSDKRGEQAEDQGPWQLPERH
jgi:hypothetical protein